jgi:endonuclease III
MHKNLEIFTQVLHLLGGKFSSELGLNLALGPHERQKWFLAALLYGARISGHIAARTFHVFLDRGVWSPQQILAQGWDNLVALLDAGGYARYDFKTATKLLKVMETLKTEYGGDLELLAGTASDYEDLEGRLRSLAPGVGHTTVNIFLRELRGIWPLATPPLSSLAQLAGEHLQILEPGLSPETALAKLTAVWEAHPVPGFDLADLEAALVRLGRDHCRKAASPACPLGLWCPKRQV